LLFPEVKRRDKRFVLSSFTKHIETKLPSSITRPRLFRTTDVTSLKTAFFKTTKLFLWLTEHNIIKLYKTIEALLLV